jgi:hypothetical protein
MRLRHAVVATTLAAFPLHDRAAVAQLHGSSRNLATIGAVEPGAVYELKLRIKWDDVEPYLNLYAIWYLPVDQFVCDPASGCESSGRKLVSVLSRDIGDPYNVIFLYRYESEYKESYYCKYDKAFFQYHAAERTRGFETYVKTASNTANTRYSQNVMTLEEVLQKLPKNCSQEQYTPDEVSAFRVADATINLINHKLAKMVDSEESNWSFDVNLCKVFELAGQTPLSNAEAAALQAACPAHKQSMLERAVKAWASKWLRDPSPSNARP